MRWMLMVCLFLLFSPHLQSGCPDAEAVHQEAHPAVFQLLDGRDERPRGSGFLAGPEGLAVTNAHVVLDPPEALKARFPEGETRAVQVLARDRGTDLALLEVADIARDPLAVATREVRVGEPVLGLASPHGFATSLSVGHVSAVGRQFPGEPGIPYLQVELGVHPGSSGGPVLDQDGAVVGVMTQVVAGEDGAPALSFALPSWLLARTLDQLGPEGGQEPGWLGLEATRTDAGLEVSALARGGPAERAGLAVGDRLVPLGGGPVSRARFQAELLRPGARETIPVVRVSEAGREPLSLTPRPVSEVDRDLPVQEARVRPAASPRPKVEVIAAQPGGVLEVGDRISRVAGERLESPDMLLAALREAGEGGLAVLIHRDGDRFYGVLRAEEE